MNLASWVERNAEMFPDRPALSLGDRPILNHKEWAASMRAVAGYLLHDVRCKPGNRVGIVMSNSPAYLQAQFAIWHAGLVAVPINSRLHPDEVQYIFDDAGVVCAFVDADHADPLVPLVGKCAALHRVIVIGDVDWRAAISFDGVAMRDREPNDEAWLFYTSGTTGRPKGATLTHRNLMMQSLAHLADIDFLQATDTVLHAAPLSHGSGMCGLPHVARGANNVMTESGQFSPDEIARILASWKGVSFFAAPTMIGRLLADSGFVASDKTNLKTIVYGGAPMYTADLLKALEVFGPRLAQIYGQGEAPMTITSLSKNAHADTLNPRYMERLASTGTRRTSVDVRIVDADDRFVPEGEVGEVVVRGDVVMSGYLNNAEATAVTLRNGWLHTGDVGSFDSDGFLTLRDRVKDVIISGGQNIYPREVEEVLLRHQAVSEVSVVGEPDPEWGESVVAVVVPDPEATNLSEADLDAHCLGSIARYKRPKRYVFVSELPKNNYGKIPKTELRRLLSRH